MRRTGIIPVLACGLVLGLPPGSARMAFAANQASVVEARVASAETRVAMVVGNADYSEDRASNISGVPDLANTLNDARSVRDLLTGLGFRVVYGEDLTKREMERAMAQFAKLAGEAAIAVAYYSGHGSTFGDIPYLVPVDAHYEALEEIPYELIRTEDFIAELRRASGVGIALLDACRDNEAEQALKQRSTRGGALTRGLARVAAAEGLIIMYATQYLKTAADGTSGGNSPFTAALLSELPKPGIDVKQALFGVAEEVVRTSNGAQRPELSVSLFTPFQLVPGDAPPTGGGGAGGPASPADAGAGAYQAAMGLDTIKAWDAFLKHFPDGYWADLARARKDELEAAQSAEEERRRQEAALRADEERRQQEAAARAQAEKRAREAALRTEKERARTAALRAEQERQATFLQGEKAYEAGNFGEAVRLYGIASEQGHARATALLGYTYEYGKGVKKNGDKAFELFSRAAALRDVQGKFSLAWAYNNGMGTARDSDVSGRLFLEVLKSGENGEFYAKVLSDFRGQLHRDTISALQTGLRAEGHYDGAVDGAFGPSTKSALDRIVGG